MFSPGNKNGKPIAVLSGSLFDPCQYRAHSQSPSFDARLGVSLWNELLASPVSCLSVRIGKVVREFQ